MKFLEKDLEEIIFNTPKEKLEEKGFWKEGIMKRQLKIGNYGVADLVTFSMVKGYLSSYINKDGLEKCIYEQYLDITVYELKKDKISMSAFLQAIRYAKGIKSYLNKRGFKFEVRFNLHLVGRTIDPNSDFIYLGELFENIYFTTYSYDIDGISFDRVGNYLLTKEGF